MGSSAFSSQLQQYIADERHPQPTLKIEDLEKEQAHLLQGDLEDLLHDDNWFQAATYDRKAFPAVIDRQQRAANIIKLIPPAHIVSGLVDTFFSEVHWYYGTVDHIFFAEELSQWLAVRPNVYEATAPTKEIETLPAVLFQILALGLHFAKHADLAKLGLKDASSCDDLSVSFSDSGMELLDTLGRNCPTISFVQAGLLRTAWLKNCGRSTEAWQSLGTAVRQAQDLGLHRKDRPRKFSTTEEQCRIMRYDEYKRRLWAELFVWDSIIAFVQGRPRRILINDCDVPPPNGYCPSTDISQSFLRSRMCSSDEYPSTTGLSFLYAVSLLVHRMRDAHVDKEMGEKYDIILQLHQELMLLADTVPEFLRLHNTNTSLDAALPYLPRQRERLFTLVHHTLMGLHRAQVTNHIHSRIEFTHSAMACLESQERFFRLTPVHQYRLYELTYYTIDAAIMLSAITVAYPPKDLVLRRRVSDDLQKAIVRLEMMKDCSPTATSGLLILVRCYQRVQKALAVEQSPQKDAIFATSRTSTGLLTLGSELQDVAFSQTQVHPEPLPMNGLEMFGDNFITAAKFNNLLRQPCDDASWLDLLSELPTLPLGESADLDWTSIFCEPAL